MLLSSIFGVCSLTTLPSHYGDFMRQLWDDVGWCVTLVVLVVPLWARVCIMGLPQLAPFIHHYREH